MKRALPVTVLVVLAVASVLAGCGGRSEGKVTTFTVPSTAMEPTFSQGEKVKVHEIDPDDVEVGDIVVLTEPWKLLASNEKRGEIMLRVIGTPRSTVDCDPNADGGKVRVNGKALDESYLAPGTAPCSELLGVTIPRTYVWLMGDNRDSADDSRAHVNDLPTGGWVMESLIKGVVHPDGK